ncbi:MAG: DUF362 domain-containing protein [Chloroflexota bacterium]
MATVAIAQNDDIAQALEEALSYFDLDPLFRGKLVAIHPNDTYATPTDTTAVTQPDTLEAAIRYVKRFGPRHIVISGGSGSRYTTDEVFQNSGMIEVVQREGVEYFDHNRGPYVMVPLQYGPMSEVAVNPRILEYETVISLGQLKLHRESVLVASIKNIAMSWPCTDYYGLPRMWNKYGRSGMVKDKDGFIAGMAQRFPIHLAIVVGHPAMIATGPTHGIPVETGLVIAGLDAVAVDAICAHLMGFSTYGVKYLREAAQLGVGEGELVNISTLGLTLDDATRHFTKRAYGVETTLT